MASSRMQRMRPAHAPGPTYLSYTPNGRKLITVGSNDAFRVFEHGSQGEPTNIDDCHDSNTAIVAANDFFVTGSEDGTVSKYSLNTNALDEILTRCSLPIRNLALSPDNQWVAVASDELTVKIVNTTNMTHVLYIRDLPKPAKHVSFDYSGSTLAVSCSDGVVYFYSLGTEEPRLVRKVDGLIRALETDAEASSAVEWHPDGRAFGVPTSTREVQVMSTKDWEKQRSFKSGHTGDVTALAWSPNGALLVTAGTDRLLCLWETKTQKVLKKYDDVRANVLAFSWHPVDNTLSYTNAEGELHIHADFVPDEYISLLELGLQPAPFIHDPLKEISGNARRREEGPQRLPRKGTPETLDDILGPEDDSDLDGFIEDDEGENQVNGHGKRSNGHLDPYETYASKRRPTRAWEPEIHESFQPGSTPWRGNRRYLCLNLIGFVWTVDQDTHSTVTVEFYDREFQRDFHFTDPFGYDKACLTEKGTLFASPSKTNQAAQIYYRPHEHWTSDRSDWRASLPRGEEVTAVALSESFIVVTTSTNYVRVYTLFGVPFKVYRQKCAPMVTCTSWRDYVLTMGNGAVGADGTTQLVYSIENVKRDEVCQNEDIVALPAGVQVQNVFFSDSGDPYVYDTTGVLLVLRHWRTPSAAQWTPLLDTRNLSRLATGRKEETYWPVAVSGNKFYCIILKGGDRYPYFPRPLLNEFEFEVPLRDPQPSTEQNGADESSTNDEARRLEESYVRTSVLHSLQDDLIAATNSTSAQRAELATKQLEIDKVLLQLLAAECVEGEEKGMKALEICGLMRDRTGKMLDAAGKVAGRFGREVLGEKIRELAERRLVGLDDEED